MCNSISENRAEDWTAHEVEYIKMLNDHIIRMDDYSVKCKCYCVTILSFIYGSNIIIGQEPLNVTKVRILSLITLLAFWIMDVNVHSISHRYRSLEKDFLTKGKKDIFFFKKEEKLSDKLGDIWKSVITLKNWPFYMALLIGIYILNH